MNTITELKVDSFHSFLTGSTVYGAPTAESDVDLVIRCGRDVEEALMMLSDDPQSKAIRFGKLNLITCITEDEFHGWKEGTKELIARMETEGPIDREEAKKVFSKYRGQSAP